MSERRHLLGAILTGGASRRFGEDKARVIGPIVLAAMRSAGVDPVVSVGGDSGALAVPNLADRYPGEGPLGGVATALSYARRGWVLVVPCDHPHLVGRHLAPFVDRLVDLDADTALVASVDGELVVGLACWPASWARRVHAALRTGERRFQALTTMGPIEPLVVDAEAVVDADDRATFDGEPG